MPIELRGLAFNASLTSELEKNLLQKGFCLEEFVFEKERYYRPVPGVSVGTLEEYNYTVSIGGKRFSIIFTDDVQFLRYFYNLCCPPEEDGDHGGRANLLDSIIIRAERCVEITKHWLTEDPFKSQ